MGVFVSLLVNEFSFQLIDMFYYIMSKYQTLYAKQQIFTSGLRSQTECLPKLPLPSKLATPRSTLGLNGLSVHIPQSVLAKATRESLAAEMRHKVGPHPTRPSTHVTSFLLSASRP